MTPEQRAQLIAAADSGDDVRAVTVALAVAATAARANRGDDAMAIRRLVDHLRTNDAAEREHRRLRLDIAARICAGNQSATFADCVDAADRLIAVNDRAPVPQSVR